jgi:hypothetical protein
VAGLRNVLVVACSLGAVHVAVANRGAPHLKVNSSLRQSHNMNMNVNVNVNVNGEQPIRTLISRE